MLHIHESKGQMIDVYTWKLPEHIIEHVLKIKGQLQDGPLPVRNGVIITPYVAHLNSHEIGALK